MRGIDEGKVGAWIAATVPRVAPPFGYELIPGGHSNLTFTVTDAAGRRLVLRRPPLGHVLATAHDVAREHRIISALGPTPVPVPPAVGLCTDEGVNGAPFYVMDFVDGVVLDHRDKVEAIAPDVRHALGLHLIDVLAELHAVNVDAVGLGDLARREGYVERQLRRWSKQWAASRTRELPAVEEAERLLAARIPPQQGTAIAHGDYRLGNCIASGGRVAAVLDWELCTLGDPLADLGYIGVRWSGRPSLPLREDEPTVAGGFPSFDDLVERYARTTGRDVSMIDYYVAFSAWRLAVISEGVYARYVAGAMADDGTDVVWFKEATERLAAFAADTVAGL